MLEKLRKNWRTFRNAPAGKRFQQQYEAQRRSNRPAWMKPLMIIVGIVVIAGGAVALPAPGPGILILAFGAALIAREFRWAAKGLDWLGLRLRALLKWALKVWKQAPLIGKAAIVTVALAVAGGTAWLAWTLYLRDKFT